mmetsp:Transcript_20275/g.33047  ORF Transcript_20275/g.33047 Transcript_20275/m.33047 type:complete len:248 (+) Transcript_20275:229-972(+)
MVLPNNAFQSNPENHCCLIISSARQIKHWIPWGIRSAGHLVVLRSKVLQLPNIWFEWHLHGFSQQCIPVKSRKPLVLYDFISATLRPTQSPRLLTQQFGNEIRQRLTEARWGGERTLDNFSRCLGRVVSIERRIPMSNLMEKNSQSPIVNTPVMTLAANNFRGQVIGRAAECPCLPLVAVLGKAKVNEVAVTIRIQDKILRFQVTIGDLLLVNALKGRQDSGAIEARPTFWERLLRIKKIHQLPSGK